MNLKQSTIFQNFVYLCFVLLLLLTALSYHPRYADVAMHQHQSNPLNRYVYLLTVVTFMSTFSLMSLSQHFIIRKYYKFLIFFGIELLVLFGASHYRGAASDIVSILMSFLFVLIGFNIQLDHRRWVIALVLYALVLSYSIYGQMISRFGGLVISSQYLSYGKNTMGVMAASVGLALFVIGFGEQRRLWRYLFWGITFVLFMLIVYIRARADMLIFGLMVVVVLYQMRHSLSNQNTLAVVSLLVLASVLLVLLTSVGDSLASLISDSFTRNRDGDITTGRADRNVVAIQTFVSHPFLGSLGTDIKIEQVHNYFLRILSSYGLVAGLAFILLYLQLFVFLVKKVFHNVPNLSSIGYYVCLIPFGASFAEPTFPYSPGTGTILGFVLLGCSLQNSLSSNS